MRQSSKGRAAAIGAVLACTACGANEGADRTARAREPVLKSSEVELVPADGAPNRSFGSVHFDGQTAIVGAEAKQAMDAGYAYFYSKQDGFAQQGMVTAGQQYLSSAFGEHVAVAGDRAVVSSFQSAFVFARAGSSWALEKELGSALGGGHTIAAVAIDGDTAVLGSAQSDRADVYRRGGGGWAFETTLTADDPTPTPELGAGVVVRGDLLFVAAPARWLTVYALDTDPPGAVYVFRRDASGWKRTQKLTASDTSNGDLFGFSLAYDGTTLVVGAPGADAGGEDVGAIYVFGENAGQFVEQARIDTFPSGNSTNGNRVAVEGDILVNSPYSGASPGFAEVFTRESAGWEPALTLHPSGNADSFGSSMSMAGNRLAVGGDGHAYAFWLQREGTCTADATSVDLGNGKLEPCSPYLCAAGTCAAACTDSAACAAGFVCDREQGQGTCVKSGGVSQDSGGCALGSGPGRAGVWLLLVPLLGRVCSRRRRDR